MHPVAFGELIDVPFINWLRDLVQFGTLRRGTRRRGEGRGEGMSEVKLRC